VISVGSRVGGYTVLHLLGQGGMGQVYLAQHHRIARRAAIKVLLPELSANESVVERFFTEARATSLIRHPGIVEVLDCDVREGQAYIVMEHLEGESVADYLERTGGLGGDNAFALGVTGQVALAVGAAHAAGIVHRDLKPDNVFLSISNTDGRIVPKVLDFGIAKLAERGSATHTRTGAVLGTPAYMSPEQCRGGSKVVDGRSDVYSLGCILYEMLCGEPPFVRDGMGDLIVAHVSEAPQPPRARVPGLPPVLDQLVMQMLAKAPGDRPQTMETVAIQLTDCLAALGTRAPFADIHPRHPVVVPVLPEHFPVAAPTPSSASSAATPGDAMSPVRTTPFGVGQAGNTRVLPDQEPVRRPAPSTTFRNAVGEKAPDAFPLQPRRSSAARATIILIAILGIGGVGTLVALRGQIFASATTAEPDPPSAAENQRQAPQPPLPEKVTVDLPGLPDGAEVLVDGLTVQTLPVKLPRGDRRHQLVVRAPGRQQRSIEIDGSRDRVVELELAPIAPTATPSPRVQEATATPRKNAREEKRTRDGHRRAATEGSRRPVGAPSDTTVSTPPPAENPPPPKTNPPKPPRSSYDEM
jgi:serine/threonine-protein kinase